MRRACPCLLTATFTACVFPDGAAPGERNAEYEACRARAEPDERCPSPGCPAGERCSSRAPHGLRFRGAVLADAIAFPTVDEAPKPIAAGGHQLLRFGATWFPNERPHLIATSEDVGVLEVVTASATEVHVRGLREGRARIRIDDELGLLDRIAIDVVGVDRVELGPMEPRLGGLPLFGFEPQQRGFDRWAVLRDDPAPIYVRLFSGDRRVVDQALTEIHAPTSTRTIVRQHGWDAVVFTAGSAPTAGMVVRVGFAAFGEDVRVATGIDTIEQLTHGRAPPDQVRGRHACFVARNAASGGAILTADWRFTPGPGVVIARALPGPGFTCVELAEQSAKTGTLSVEASSASATFTLALD